MWAGLLFFDENVVTVFVMDVGVCRCEFENCGSMFLMWKFCSFVSKLFLFFFLVAIEEILKSVLQCLDRCFYCFYLGNRILILNHVTVFFMHIITVKIIV